MLFRLAAVEIIRDEALVFKVLRRVSFVGRITLVDLRIGKHHHRSLLQNRRSNHRPSLKEATLLLRNAIHFALYSWE